MADGDIEWVVIDRFGKNIGAIGFIGDEVAVIVAFYDDQDANKDGKVSWGEWGVSKLSPISVKGMAVAEVAMQARDREDVTGRDSSFREQSAKILTNFAGGMIIDGVYAAYFKFGIGQAAGAVAGQLTTSAVKQFVIKKGMEAAVRKAYDQSMDRQR